MPSWERAAIAAAAIVATLVLAKLVDLRLSRRQLAPEAATRYRVLRRSIVAGIVVFGVLSALLVVPQVRAIAGGILASGAVVAIVVGFAAQQTLSNFISGLLIAFSQPLRLGDRVTFGGEEGVVEEIGLDLHVHPHPRPGPARDPERANWPRIPSATPPSSAGRSWPDHRAGTARQRSRQGGRPAARRDGRWRPRRRARDVARRRGHRDVRASADDRPPPSGWRATFACARSCACARPAC